MIRFQTVLRLMLFTMECQQKKSKKSLITIKIFCVNGLIHSKSKSKGLIHSKS